MKESQTNLLLVNYETFFMKSSSKQTISIADTLKTSSVNNLFLQSLIKIEISTEFDARERKFSKNYASIIDQNDNPELLMEFHPLEDQLDFTIEWYSANGIVI